VISSLQLAQLCGVSQGTVDRALHNRPGISRATRAHILRSAAEHGYKPHPAVRELLRGEKNVVGAIIPLRGGAFFMDLMRAVHSALAEEGWRLFLCHTADEAAFLEALGDFAARRCRGVIAVPPRDDLHLTAQQAGGMPVIALLSPCTGPHVCWLSPDEVATGRQAVDYLWSQGHRRILHYTYTRDTRAIRDRAEGYRRALRQRGATPTVVRQGRGSDLAEAVRAQRATAVFCHNDWLALTVMRELAGARLRVPDDVSVLGVDNSPTFTDLCDEITTLAYPMGGVAKACVRILHGRPPRAADIGGFELVERRTVRPVS